MSGKNENLCDELNRVWADYKEICLYPSTAGVDPLGIDIAQSRDMLRIRVTHLIQVLTECCWAEKVAVWVPCERCGGGGELWEEGYGYKCPACDGRGGEYQAV